MRQFVYAMFISNNQASFHLWCKENLTKHQKVSKYDENGCGDDLLLLGITIGKKLTFKQHIENLCQKEQHKLHALRFARMFLQ